jgi:hypothetical protein
VAWNAWSPSWNNPGIEKEIFMSQGTLHKILRWLHIIVAIPIYGYIYSPFDKLPLYAPPTRFVFFPFMVVSGLLMWKGHVLRRLVVKRLA